MADIRIGVVGAAGRMGRMLVRTVVETEGCVLAGATEAPGNPAIGRDAAALAGLDDAGVAIGDDAAQLFADIDAVVDFTAPAASAAHAALAAQSKAAHVIGTTGLGAGETAEIEKAARHTAIVQAPNMSLGVNLLLALTEQAARVLGDDYDVEIVEMHHRHKVDAPSGTALGLGEAAARGRAVALADVSQRVRDGHTGPRRRGDIGFATLRGGDVVGEHDVIFAGAGERVVLGHRAGDRAIFARGAVRAAMWAAIQPPGLYGMKDVLGLP